MEIFRAESRAQQTAPSEYFTGCVEMDPLLIAPAPATLRTLLVHFSPGGRTNWHTHPRGQTLYVVSGRGRAQQEGEPVREIRPGDVIWFPPNVRHWHGASPNEAMSHIAMQEEPDGETTAWAEAVSDADYRAEPRD